MRELRRKKVMSEWHFQGQHVVARVRKKAKSMKRGISKGHFARPDESLAVVVKTAISDRGLCSFNSPFPIKI